MKTLYMMKGLPGSGKSTKARLMIESRPPGSILQVNRDELRRMLAPGVGFNKTVENAAKGLRNTVISTGLQNGLHVVADDTNFGWEDHLRLLAKNNQADFQVVDLTNVPLETCITQDLKREHSVGKDVIVGMWKKWLAPKPQDPPAYDPSLPDCVIVDIDGTLATMKDRGPYEWDKVGQDEPRKLVFQVIRKFIFREGRPIRVIFMSGRDGVCRDLTMDWLVNQDVALAWGENLLMRPQGDMRRDSVVKKELYQQHIEGKYNVVAIFDDRPQVIRECWQVGRNSNGTSTAYGVCRPLKVSYPPTMSSS